MPHYKSLVGKRFGKLKVIERAENNLEDKVCFKCLCDCGNTIVLSSKFLQNAKGLSCGCQIRFAWKQITVEDFIFRARKAHGDKFDYSKSQFKTVRDPTIIICPFHGEFKQGPRVHWESIHGCPSCANDIGSFSYSKRFKNRSNLGKIYLLRLSDALGDSYIKIGVTINLKRRVKEYIKLGLKVQIIGSLPMTAEDSGYVERDILKFIRKNKMLYTPNINFAGKNECFKEEHLDFILEKLEEILIEKVEEKLQNFTK